MPLPLRLFAATNKLYALALRMHVHRPTRQGGAGRDRDRESNRRHDVDATLSYSTLSFRPLYTSTVNVIADRGGASPATATAAGAAEWRQRRRRSPLSWTPGQMDRCPARILNDDEMTSGRRRRKQRPHARCAAAAAAHHLAHKPHSLRPHASSESASFESARAQRLYGRQNEPS